MSVSHLVLLAAIMQAPAPTARSHCTPMTTEGLAAYPYPGGAGWSSPR